jgi:hypothetical protein
LQTANAKAAVATIGRQIEVFAASTNDEIDAAFDGIRAAPIQSRTPWSPLAAPTMILSLTASGAAVNVTSGVSLEPTRYHRISHNPVAIKRLLVDLFVEAHARAPKQIILDLDATDDPRERGIDRALEYRTRAPKLALHRSLGVGKAERPHGSGSCLRGRDDDVIPRRLVGKEALDRSLVAGVEHDGAGVPGEPGQRSIEFGPGA